MKKLSNKQNKKAFTIIEVVLVLAVAGLIFLVVFQAVPSMQASRRDNQRKRDADLLLGMSLEYMGQARDVPRWAIVNQAFIDYNANNTSSTNAFYNFIKDEDFKDPQNGGYIVAGNGAPYTALLPTGSLWIGGFTSCNPGGSPPAGAGNSKDLVVVMGLERGNYCIESKGG